MTSVRLRFSGIAVALLLATAMFSPAAVHAQDFNCTEVIGYSQTMQWYFAGFPDQAGGRAHWQLRWQGGGSIDNWAGPGYVGWSTTALVTGCASNSNRPDRILLDVSDDYHNDVGWWVGQINTVLGIIHSRYPGARQIMLQPVVGGPGGGSCSIGGKEVRAAFNHPFIWQAINQVAGGDVVAGANPTVRSCGDYADNIGHLQDFAKAPIASSIAQFYASGQIAPPPPAPPEPVQPPAPPPQPGPPTNPPPTPDFGTFCPPDATPEVTLGFAILRTAVGDAMGAPMDCEHPDQNGDVLQDTTTGLAFYRVSTNTPTFTDG